MLYNGYRMKLSRKNKVNFIKIPKSICMKLDLHRWFYTARSHSFLSQKCSRCGMNGIEYKKLKKS